MPKCVLYGCLILLVACSPGLEEQLLPGTALEHCSASGAKLVHSEDLFDARLLDNPVRPAGQFEKIDPAEGNSPSVLRVTTLQKPRRPFTLRVVLPLEGSINQGDVLALRISARTLASSLSTGEGQMWFGVRFGSSDLDPARGFRARIKSDWREYLWPMRVPIRQNKKKSQAEIHLSYAPQILELREAEIINCGKAASLEQTGSRGFTYEGRESDALWRKAAEQRIEAIRKATLEVRVFDQTGSPLPGAKVRVEMKRHQFRFGSAVSVPVLLGDTEDAEKYRQTLLANFNTVVLENSLKMRSWHGDWPKFPREATLRALSWLKENQLYVRGHTAMWASWIHLPDSYQKYKDSPNLLNQAILEHIEEITTATRDMVDEWDILNEPSIHHQVIDLIGREAMIDWFQQAHKNLPDTPLYVNDFNNIEQNSRLPEQFFHFDQTIAYLLGKNAPLGGIGLQGHFFTWNLPGLSQVFRSLDHLARFGLPLTITEFDVNIGDTKLQAEFTRDLITAAFSHPAVNGIVLWGFWEGAHWLPEAALFRKDWSIKPNGKVFRDLVHKQWWTHAKGKTDRKGRYTVRGFLGEYSITVNSRQGSKTVDIELPQSGTVAEIQLGESTTP